MEPTSSDVSDHFFIINDSQDESLDQILSHLNDKINAISKLTQENRIADFTPKAQPGWLAWAFSYLYSPKPVVEIPLDTQLQTMSLDLLNIIDEAERLSGNNLEEKKKVLESITSAKLELLKLLAPKEFLDKICTILKNAGNDEGVKRLEKLQESLEDFFIKNLQNKIQKIGLSILSANQEENSRQPGFLSGSSSESLRTSDSSSLESSAPASLRASDDSSADEVAIQSPPPSAEASEGPPPPPPPPGIGAPPPPPPPGVKQEVKPKIDPEAAHIAREKQRLEKELQKRSDPSSWIYLSPPSDNQKATLEIQKDTFEKAKQAMGTLDTSAIDRLIDEVRSKMDGKLVAIGPNNLGEIIRNLSKLTSEELRILMHFASGVIRKRYQDEKLPDAFFDTKIQRDFYPENEKIVDLLRSSPKESLKAFFIKEEAWTKYMQESLLADTVYKESFSLIRDRMRNPKKEPVYTIRPFKQAAKSDENEGDSIARSQVLSGILSQPKLRQTPTTERKVEKNPLADLRVGLKASKQSSEQKSTREGIQSTSSSASSQAGLRRNEANEERLAKLRMNETHEFYRLKFRELAKKIEGLKIEKGELEELLQTESSSLDAAALAKTRERLRELNTAIEDFENGEIALKNGFRADSGTAEGAKVDAFIKKMSSGVNLKGENELEKYLERVMKKYER